MLPLLSIARPLALEYGPWIGVMFCNQLSFVLVGWLAIRMFNSLCRQPRLVDIKSSTGVSKRANIVRWIALFAVLACIVVVTVDTLLYLSVYSSLTFSCSALEVAVFASHLLSGFLMLVCSWLGQSILYENQALDAIARKPWIRFLNATTIMYAMICAGPSVIKFVHHAFVISRNLPCDHLTTSMFIQWPILLLSSAHFIGFVQILVLYVVPLRQKSIKHAHPDIMKIFEQNAVSVATVLVCCTLCVSVLIINGGFGVSAYVYFVPLEITWMCTAYCVVDSTLKNDKYLRSQG